MTNKIKVKIYRSLNERIENEDGKFVVYPERGGKRLGTHDTEEDAKKQLAAIEISKAQNEAVIATKDGDKEVKASRGETEHFFVHKSGKRYIVTHKPSGKALPAVVTKYGTKLSDFQKVMKDLEDANIAGIGEENPSPETLRAIKDVLKKIDERCQKGYKTHATRKTKVMFGKRYRNCVKAEEQQVTKARNKKK
jgi:uncharacterized protein involved in exopolysaccharide biosynthesis